MMKTSIKPWLILALLTACSLSPRALLACASCGSGSGSPLILYPNESIKAYLGLSHQTAIESIGHDGKLSNASEPERKTSLSLAAGFRPLSHLSVVWTQPYSRNATSSRAKTDFADPYLELRYDLHRAAWDRASQPQIQLVLGHKFSLTSPIYETQDMRQLDVFGNGFDESTAGMDIWWSMLSLKPGLAVIATKAWEKSYRGIAIEKGLKTQIVLGVGHNLVENLHLNTGVRLERKTEDKNDGKSVNDSDSRQDDLFLSLRWSSSLQELKLSLFMTGFGDHNKNSVRSKAISLGFAQGI